MKAVIMLVGVATASLLLTLSGETQTSPQPSPSLNALILRCPLMGNFQVSVYDPSAALALRDQLKLTDQQITELTDLAGKMKDEVMQKDIADD